MRAVSLAALTVLEAGAAASIRIAAKCGYSHVGLRPIPATTGEPQDDMAGDPALARQLEQLLADEGVAVLDIEIFRLEPAMDWDRMARALDFGARVGASRLLVADNDSDTARSRESLARLAEVAAQLGLVACLEFMPWTNAANFADAGDRIAGIDNTALLIDAFHLVRSGGAPADIATADPRISYLQLCDIAGPIPPMDEILREARSDRLLPGDGDVNLAELLHRLPAIPVSLEMPSDRLRAAGHDALARAQMAMAATRRLLAQHG